MDLNAFKDICVFDNSDYFTPDFVNHNTCSIEDSMRKYNNVSKYCLKLVYTVVI